MTAQRKSKLAERAGYSDSLASGRPGSIDELRPFDRLFQLGGECRIHVKVTQAWLRYRSSEGPAGLRLGNYSGRNGIFTVMPIYLLLRDALEPATLLVLLLLSADLLSTAFFHRCSFAK